MYWNLLRREADKQAAIDRAGRVDPTYAQSLRAVIDRGGNPAGFEDGQQEGEEEGDGDGDVDVPLGGRVTSQHLWTDALTSDAAAEKSKERQEAGALAKRKTEESKEATSQRRAAVVAASLALVPQATAALAALPVPLGEGRRTHQN